MTGYKMASSNATSPSGCGGWDFMVSTMFPCDEITEGLESYRPDPIWRTTALGCKMLELLRDMFHFNMTYEKGEGLLMADNVSFPDIYAMPMPLLPHVFAQASPIDSIINRRYGFILRTANQPITVRAFYTLPFTRCTWCILTLITYFIITPLLYFLSRWEEKVVASKQEHSLSNELMVVFGASCQHIPPVNPVLQSRRCAYFITFMYTWILYSYYSSNLLSHLVNDKEKTMTIFQIVESDYEFLVLDSLQLKGDSILPWYTAAYRHDLERSFSKSAQLTKKVQEMKSVNLSTGLIAVATQQVALLSDYITIYPYGRKYFDNEAICDIIEIDLFSNIKEFIYTSKKFPLTQQFRIGMLRIKEAGLLKRIKHDRIYSPPKCHQTSESIATFHHIVGPLLVLGAAFGLSTLVLTIERAYYDRNIVWPYVD